MASEHTMYVGEALVGDGNEIAHIDLLIGKKDRAPSAYAFANALANQSAGHSSLLAVLEPNLLTASPPTVLITKVTIKGMKQAVQMFGPAQYAVAKAVADCLGEGHHSPAAEAEGLVIICGVFIHPAAEDNKKILDYNLRGDQAVRSKNAMSDSPPPWPPSSPSKDKAKHPFARGMSG